jgi:hypothetical protein
MRGFTSLESRRNHGDDAVILLAADACTAAITHRLPEERRGADARPRSARTLVPEQFCGWLAKAMPGDTTVYYHGHLGRDRCRSTSALSESDRLRLIALARQALLAAEDGRVHLLQRRHGEDEYSYIAIGTSPRRAGDQAHQGRGTR